MGRKNKSRRFTEADEDAPNASDTSPQASPPADALALLKWRPGLSGAECKRRAKELKKAHVERRSAAQSLGRPSSRHPRHKAQQEEDKADQVDVETCTFVNDKLPPPPALGISAEEPRQGAEGSSPEPAAPSLPFDSLPTAVWYRVLSRLDACSACRTMATCSSLRLAAADPRVWEAVQRSTFGLQPHGGVSPTLLQRPSHQNCPSDAAPSESSHESGRHQDHVIARSPTAAGNEGFPAEISAESQQYNNHSPLELPIFHVRAGLRAGYSRPARSRCCESEASLRRWQNLTFEAPCKSPLPGMTAAALLGGDLGLSIHEQDLGRRTMTRVWDAVTGRRLLSHAMPRGSPALTCCAGAGGRHALVGDERGFVHHFDLDDEAMDSGFVPRQSLLVGGHQHYQDQDEQQPHQIQQRDDEDGLPPACLRSLVLLPASSGQEAPVCVACTAGGHLAAWRLGEQEVLWREAMGAEGIAAAKPSDRAHDSRQRQHSLMATSAELAAANGNSVFVSGTLSHHGDPGGAGTNDPTSGEVNAMLFDIERRVRTWCGIAGSCYDSERRNSSVADASMDEILARQMRGLVLPGLLAPARTGRRARPMTPVMQQQQQRLSYSYGWQLLAGIHGGCAHLWDPRCSGRSAMGVVALPDGMQAGSVFVDQGWGGWPGQLLLGAASGCSVHVFDIRNARRAWLGGGSGAAHLGKFELSYGSTGSACWTADAGGLVMGSTDNTKGAAGAAYLWRVAR